MTQPAEGTSLRHGVWALIVLAAACGDDQGPTSIPDVTGDYAVTYIFTEPETKDSFSCSGALQIREQSEGDFTGLFTLEASDDCTAQGGEFTGTVQAGGAITFSGLFEGAVGLEQIPGCSIVGGDSALRGTWIDGRLTVSSTVQLRCRVGLGSLQQFPLTLEVVGSRSAEGGLAQSRRAVDAHMGGEPGHHLHDSHLTAT